MTRKLLLLFITLLISLNLLIASFLGERGYFYNKALKQEISSQETVLNDLNNNLNNFKATEANTKTENYLKDSAIKLGYKKENDKVYYFTSTPYPFDQTEKNAEVNIQNTDIYYIKPFTIFVISFILSLIIVLINYVKDKRKNQNGSK